MRTPVATTATGGAFSSSTAVASVASMASMAVLVVVMMMVSCFSGTAEAVPAAKPGHLMIDFYKTSSPRNLRHDFGADDHEDAYELNPHGRNCYGFWPCEKFSYSGSSGLGAPVATALRLVAVCMAAAWLCSKKLLTT